MFYGNCFKESSLRYIEMSYYELNREARLAYQKKYKQEHKEQYNEYQKLYHYKYNKGAYNRARINQQKMESYHRRKEAKAEQVKNELITKKEEKPIPPPEQEPEPEPEPEPIFVGPNGNFYLEW